MCVRWIPARVDFLLTGTALLEDTSEDETGQRGLLDAPAAPISATGVSIATTHVTALDDNLLDADQKESPLSQVELSEGATQIQTRTELGARLGVDDVTVITPTGNFSNVGRKVNPVGHASERRRNDL